MMDRHAVDYPDNYEPLKLNIMQLRKATKQQLKIKMGLAGVSGSGKTMSALLMAYGMVKDWSKVALIDTENRSSELYTNLKKKDVKIGQFNVLQLVSPYNPERYIEAIETCEADKDIEVIIIDGISQEWDGKGGILDIKDNTTGNSFTVWAKLTPRHNSFINKIVQSPKHIICCMRSKQDYVLQEKEGKFVPEKLGLKAVTREGFDYEMTLVFDIDIKHNAKASKDRTSVFMDRPEGIITEKWGEEIVKWCNDGAEPVKEPAPTLEPKSKPTNNGEPVQQELLPGEEIKDAVVKELDDKPIPEWLIESIHNCQSLEELNLFYKKTEEWQNNSNFIKACSDMKLQISNTKMQKT